jgi:hypothetical protein
VDDELARIEARLARLEQVVRELDARVAAAERRAPIAADGHLEVTSARSASELAAHDIAGPLGFAGRTLMVFAGAYLLRALVDSGTLPVAIGTAAGLLYAMSWLVWTDHSASRRALAGLFYGGAAVAIAYPLVWEASTRFGLLAPGPSAAALTLVAAVAFGVSWRGRLHVLAWANTVAALVTAVALVVETGVAAPYTLFLIALGIATLWLGYERDWFALRWPAALAADVAVLGVTSRALAGQGLESASTALVLQLLLLGGYLATVAARTLVRGRNVVPFEVAQTPAALAVGLGGAVAVARHAGGGGVPLGVAALAIAAGCYAVAFAFVDRRQGRGRNFYFYTSLALVLALTGAAVLMPTQPLVLTWSVLAMVAAWCGKRFSRVALTFHSAVYLVAAAFAGGLLASVGQAFVGGTTLPWPTVPTSGWVVLVASATCAAMAPARASDGAALWRAPRVTVTLLLVSGIGAGIISRVAPRMACTPGAGCDAGMLATLRTTILAICAVVLARVGREARFAEWRLLVYPVLVAGGIKLLLEDLRYSRAATLFIALGVYGAALMIAPRVARTSPRPLSADVSSDTPASV